MSNSVLLKSETPKGDVFDHIAELLLIVRSFLKGAFVDIFGEGPSRVLPQRTYFEIFRAKILMLVVLVFLIIGSFYWQG